MFSLLKEQEFTAVAILISLATSFLYLTYLMIAIVFPSKYSLESIWIGLIFFGIGGSLAVGSLFGSGISIFLRKKFDIAGRLILPVIFVYILAVGSMILGWAMADTTKFYIPIIVIFFCSMQRGLVLPGLFGFCIELDPKKSLVVIETLSVIQILVSSLFQMFGTILGYILDYPTTFEIVGLLMFVCAFPVVIFLFRRLWTKR